MSISSALSEISKRGFSDAFVARAVGVSAVSIFNYRSGKRTPNYDLGERIILLKSLVDDFVDSVDELRKK